jgi:hypothetical protein
MFPNGGFLEATPGAGAVIPTGAQEGMRWPVTSPITRGLDAVLEGFDTGVLHAATTELFDVHRSGPVGARTVPRAAASGQTHGPGLSWRLPSDGNTG